MKRFLVIFLFVPVLFLACASMGTKVSGPVTYSETVDVAGVSQSALLEKASAWATNYKNEVSQWNSKYVNNVTRMYILSSDEKSGVIKVQYYSNEIKVGIEVCKVSSNITIEVKNEKYQILFTDPEYFTFSGMAGSWWKEGPVVTENMANKVKEDWANLAASLKSYILAK
jgi:hypothetical protein